MATQKMEKLHLNTWHGLGVFEVKRLGTICGYFVGWKGWEYGYTRNVRADLYFPTREAAIKFRDDIENARQVFRDEIEQIA